MKRQQCAHSKCGSASCSLRNNGQHSNQAGRSNGGPFVVESRLELSNGSSTLTQQENCSHGNRYCAKNEVPIVWNSVKIQKKRRSTVHDPDPTLIEGNWFTNELCQKLMNVYVSPDKGPKYDEIFIYEKCKFIPDNEIGLGAMLFPPPLPPPTYNKFVTRAVHPST